MPHQKRSRKHQNQYEEQKDQWIQPGQLEENQALDNWPVHDVNAVGKIAIFDEIAQLPTETADKDEPRDPKYVQEFASPQMVGQKDADGDHADNQAVIPQLFKICQQEDARAKIGHLRGDLNL